MVNWATCLAIEYTNLCKKNSEEKAPNHLHLRYLRFKASQCFCMCTDVRWKKFGTYITYGGTIEIYLQIQLYNVIPGTIIIGYIVRSHLFGHNILGWPKRHTPKSFSLCNITIVTLLATGTTRNATDILHFGFLTSATSAGQ